MIQLKDRKAFEYRRTQSPILVLLLRNPMYDDDVEEWLRSRKLGSAHFKAEIVNNRKSEQGVSVGDIA